ncbi:APC membrane recruitment protein 2 [Astyanax mexicanus]|uniref:APC membrane recruitment protein 2 n=1 Tax=Astyanax mexicanus TaxID=7994 RepID=UPI0020CB5265|nr:APC membrane recruitment protein 2 [Astyanax mexicanus]
MDTQSESCEPPPCDPQPPGKIRKALKLFSKRKPGSSMASIFSMRSKSEGGPKSPPSRSKTLDGLTESVAPEAEAESMDLDQEESQKEDAPMEEPESGNGNGNLETTPTRQSISSITSAKSLSFLNMLRRSRKGGGGERYAQTESQRPGRQRKGLKGLFGSVRWPGKDKEAVDEVEPGPPLLASRSNSVEIIKENLTLTPRPAPRSPDDSEIEQQPPASQDEPVSSEDSTKVSETAKQPANDRLSTLLGDISSILSFDTLTSGGDIVADVEAEWAKVSNRVEETDVTGKKDNALSAAVSAKLKPTLSPTPTLSSTSSSKPSPTTTAQPFSSSTTSPKPMPSPTAKSTFSPASTPSPSILVKPTPSPTSAPTLSPVAKPDTSSSSPTPVPSPVPLTKPSPIPSTKPMQTPPTTPTSTISTKPAPIPTPIPTLEPTPSPAAAPEPATVSETSIPPTVQSAPEPPAPSVARTESTPTPTPPSITKLTLTPAPPSKPSHSTTPAPKYPPFSTSTKPAPSGPVTRPKYVTTFGLSTSRNTAPIAKLETKQQQQQPPVTKSSPPVSQTEKSGSVSARSPTSEFGPSPAAKSQAVISKPIPEHATSARPTHKPEPESPPLQATFSTGPRGEKTGVHTRPQQPQPAAQDQLPVAAYKSEKKSPAVKSAALSKIPVSGGGRPKQLHKDGQSNGDEGHWNLPTPVHEEESPVTLSRESSSKEPLSDFSTGSGAVTPTLSHSHEDILDSRPIIGATSLPRESKIPMKPGSTATYHSLQGKTEAARSKIPVSKMPVRRTSNKPPSTATQK